MQATGQYGEVPQFVGSRVGASHGHMFNLSHDMSLSSTSTTPAQAHAHGHGLSLSHSPAQTQASQSHIQSQITSATVQPSFLQSHQQQQQQQHVQPGFNVSMGGAPPKTTSASAPSPTSHPTVHTPSQPTKALQSAAQQLQADIKQHQQQLHQIHQTAAHDLGLQQQVRTQQQAGGDPIQEIRQRQSPSAGEVYARGAEGVTNTPEQIAVVKAGGGATTREESAGDGDEVDEEGERGGGGNRWPRQEALALLKIRSEMDAAFRDSSLKGPLWEEVSRKLAEMGYQRSGKKCKEKFENVHKYYKRTKEGKTGRQDGKSYRFFSQLEALYGKAGDSADPPATALTTHHHLSHNMKSPSNNITHNTSANHVSNGNNNGLLISLNADNPSPALGLITAPNHSAALNHPPITTSSPVPLASFPPFHASSAATATAAAAAAAATNAHIARTLEKVESMKREPEQINPGLQYFFDSSSDDDDDAEDDDDDDDDDEFEEPARESSLGAAAATQNSPTRGKKRKRNSMKKYLIFFEKVMKKVLDKQEHMQQKFLEALERRDQDRMIREEAWKRQEMARLNREHDVRAAERALSASRDASLVALLQKMTGQSITLPHQYSTNVPLQPSNHHSTAIVPADYMQHESNADRDAYDPCSKRWPKPEVLALIKLRTSLDQKFHEPGSKAILWEDISAGMTALGYSRTAKRCKEKWENINKYFKKAKESNKKRPENAKTCPYFHHLNALYKEGLLGGGGGGGGGCGSSNKHLMVIDKASEEQSEGVMDQEGNTGNHAGEEISGQAQGDFEMMSTGNAIDVSGISNPMLNNAPATASPSAGIISTTSAANLSLRTSSTSMDTKMHMFMGGETKEHAGMMKDVTPSNDKGQQQPTIDLSTGLKDHP